MISLPKAVRFSKNSQTGSTAPNSEFVDEKFEVIPVSAPVKPADEQAPESPGAISLAVADDYSEEDLLFITESVVSLPSIFLPKIPLRTKEQIAPFNHQFYRYCKKKGINPFEFFFDEFGLMMAGAGLAGGIYRDYKEHYSNGKKPETKEDKKLASDFEHAKQVAEQKAKDIQAGKIVTAPPEDRPLLEGG